AVSLCPADKASFPLFSICCARFSHSRSQPSLSPGSILAHARAISNTSPTPCCAWAARRRVWPPNGGVGEKKSTINPPTVLSDGCHLRASQCTHPSDPIEIKEISREQGTAEQTS